jgi:membrane-associated protease RseP (regulator of RpoE activity)
MTSVPSSRSRYDRCSRSLMYVAFRGCLNQAAYAMWSKLPIALVCILFCVSTPSVMGQEIASQATDDQEFAQLGIQVTDSPGVGVQVEVVAIGSPADHSGIQPGDYVMAINGKPIEKPDDLVATIRTQQQGAEVGVTIWRDGEEVDKKVVLATAGIADQSTDGAWLGVTLEANGTIGAKVRQVIPGCPTRWLPFGFRSHESR